MKIPIPSPQLKRRLIEENLIAPERYDAFYAEADRKNQNILDVLVSEGVVASEYLGDLVAKMLGVGRVNLRVQPLDKNLVELLSEDIARQRQVIVFGREQNGTYDVAMADPSDLETIEFLSQHLKANVRPFLALSEDLSRGFAVYGFELGKDFKKLIEENIHASLEKQTKSAEEAAAEVPVVAIVDNLLSFAIASRASDVHVEALEDETLVRYRVDGILHEVMAIPKAIHPALLARIKLLAGLKIDEHFRPQDGRFRHRIINETVDVRVSVMPTYYGEKIEVRLLESAQKPLSIEELGFLPPYAAIVRSNLKKTYGMVLSCGPTGSGKTTTLYALINILNKPLVNIVTVEDPIEYNMRYVNQTQMNPQAGITFASGLRAILRQDPNVIMVGEIRDAETANISVQAALTGHLLLSSLHTNDAPTAIPRLFDLGVPPFLVASVLNVIVAQRLVRRICPTCIFSEGVKPEYTQIIENQFKELGNEKETHVPKTIYRGRGCPACGNSGYKGRLGIFEVLEVTDRVKTIINDRNFDLDMLRTEARKAGMRSMFEDGLEKAELALTTIDEVLRVIRE
ncbi:MAG: type II/IV secretion system protein [Candidatus Liptonbacteria bacterium]|nr:type II/IV secretion system protein [Candidatus Liptonbacteria bacterium]